MLFRGKKILRFIYSSFNSFKKMSLVSSSAELCKFDFFDSDRIHKIFTKYIFIRELYINDIDRKLNDEYLKNNFIFMNKYVNKNYMSFLIGDIAIFNFYIKNVFSALMLNIVYKNISIHTDSQIITNMNFIKNTSFDKFIKFSKENNISQNSFNCNLTVEGRSIDLFEEYKKYSDIQQFFKKTNIVIKSLATTDSFFKYVNHHNMYTFRYLSKSNYEDSPTFRYDTNIKKYVFAKQSFTANFILTNLLYNSSSSTTNNNVKYFKYYSGEEFTKLVCCLSKFNINIMNIFLNKLLNCNKVFARKSVVPLLLSPLIEYVNGIIELSDISVLTKIFHRTTQAEILERLKTTTYDSDMRHLRIPLFVTNVTKSIDFEHSYIFGRLMVYEGFDNIWEKYFRIYEDTTLKQDSDKNKYYSNNILLQMEQNEADDFKESDLELQRIITDAKKKGKYFDDTYGIVSNSNGDRDFANTIDEDYGPSKNIHSISGHRIDLDFKESKNLQKNIISVYKNLNYNEHEVHLTFNLFTF